MDTSKYAFDIETTGLCASDEISTICLHNNENSHVWYQGGDMNDPGSVEDVVDTEVHIYQFKNEHDMVDNWMGMISVMENPLLTGWYAEVWKGGFDIPFIRNACARNGLSWDIEGVEYIDLQEIFDKRFNTTIPYPSFGRSKDPWVSFGEHVGLDIDGLNMGPLKDVIKDYDPSIEEFNSWAEETGNDIPTTSTTKLDKVYEIFFGDPNLFDPLECDSKQAIEAWREGRYEDVVLHNLCDVYKTWKLYEIADEYAPSSQMRPDTL